MGWEARGGSRLPIGVAMSPRTTSHRSRQMEGLKRRLANTGVNMRPNKYNWPSMTLWWVFANPVTYIVDS